DGTVRSALFTDLYELVMAQAYDAEGMDEPAVFELSIRSMPPQRNYFVCAGLDDVLTYLEHFQFTEDDLAYLRRQGQFSDNFLDRLKGLRFTGDVYAMPEGTVVFPNEPLVQVVAPLAEAQLVETLVLNQMHFQTVAATKATRVLIAGAAQTIVDFGSRRAHGADAALKVARASYLTGAAGTSLVLAGKLYGIPIFGTMAHSYIQAHDDEAGAFAAFVRLCPEATLLVDTYDTLLGVRNVIDLSAKLGDRFRVRAIRLDSGDIASLARQARQLLDEAGLGRIQIFVSSEMDEYRIAELVGSDAPIDGFGVGTRMAVADDVPHLDMAYKLVEYAGRGRMKLSSRKAIYPGRKQVFRQIEGAQMVRDVIGRHDEHLPGQPLLQPVMRGGERLEAGRTSLADARHHARREQYQLPDALRRLDRAEPPYPVEASPALQRDFESLRRELS
ncbi:MAG TPA: nicotinate phosphoribosyltransferase, partial [Gemmataceae bacterium]|nr:nicotinate phosphoribosyltransferase [Gemmataceae bacterium]